MRRVLMSVLLAIVLVFVVLVGLNYLNSRQADRPFAGTVGTSGRLNPEVARERAADIAGKAAEVANQVDEVVSDAALTTKIKSKMALDDTVKARDIDVTTSGGVVTLNGLVHSEAEHSKAVQLARETRGVKGVIDHLGTSR